jgi:hypothetical protein
MRWWERQELMEEYSALCTERHRLTSLSTESADREQVRAIDQRCAEIQAALEEADVALDRAMTIGAAS